MGASPGCLSSRSFSRSSRPLSNRAAGLFSLQATMTEEAGVRLGLDSAIASGGGNLSVGQRQVIALARALVRQRCV